MIGVLGKNFNAIGSNLCSQYFDLFNELLNLQDLGSGLADDLIESDSMAEFTYDPEQLLSQIIDKIIASQHSQN